MPWFSVVINLKMFDSVLMRSTWRHQVHFMNRVLDPASKYGASSVVIFSTILKDCERWTEACWITHHNWAQTLRKVSRKKFIYTEVVFSFFVLKDFEEFCMPHTTSVTSDHFPSAEVINPADTRCTQPVKPVVQRLISSSFCVAMVRVISVIISSGRPSLILNI